MEHKRNTLKKIAGVGVVASLAPSSWTKPIISSVILPAHAQTSPNQAPTISGVSCSFDTPTLQVGSVITMEAAIADADNPISDMGWGILNSNSGLIVTGEGQFVTTTYTVVEGDVGNLVLELEVFDGTGNRSTELLCDDMVSAPLVAPVGENKTLNCQTSFGAFNDVDSIDLSVEQCSTLSGTVRQFVVGVIDFTQGSSSSVVFVTTTNPQLGTVEWTNNSFLFEVDDNNFSISNSPDTFQYKIVGEDGLESPLYTVNLEGLDNF